MRLLRSAPIRDPAGGSTRPDRWDRVARNAGVVAASRSAAEALLDSAQLHSAALPGPSSGRHRKQEQAVAAAGLHI